MKELKEGINIVFQELSGKFSAKQIDNLILDSIIILAWNELATGSQSFLDFSKDRIEKITKSPVYGILQNNISKFDLREDNLLPFTYEFVAKRQEKKEKYSIYYTPTWIIKYIVDNLMNHTIKNDQNIEKVKILEPACGAGMFVINIFDTLYNWYKENTCLGPGEIAKNIIENNIYGIDVDLKGLEMCKYALYLKALRETGKSLELNFNLIHQDFLEELEIDKLSFDFIVGNPPYLENRRVNKYYNKEILKNKYITAVGRFDIYSLFLEKSLNLLKEKGNLGFVLPGNLLTNNNFCPIRRLILSKTNITEIVKLGEGIFDKVSMDMIIITLEKNSSGGKDNLIKTKNISKSKNIDRDVLTEKSRLIPQFYYKSILNKVFDIDSSNVTFKLRERIFKGNYIKLNDVCEIIAGIATGNIRKKLLTYNGAKENAKKVLEGKNITDYYHRWAGLYIIDDKSIIDQEKGEYATFMRKEFINENKILIRQTSDRFICSFDSEGYYLLNTLYSLRVRDAYKKRVDIKYILAVLNSRFYSFLYRSIVREAGKVFPQIKIFHIQNSPIIIPEMKIQEMIVERVSRLIHINNEYHKEIIESKVKNKLSMEIIELKKEVDEAIYKIFQLSEEEILEIEEEAI